MNTDFRWEIIQGDALKLLEGFSPGTFDAIITDPPYASGGRTQAEKNKSTAKKYSSMGDAAPPPFKGDAKDQRSWTRWAAEWLANARKLCKPGAPVCMFIDWRQLPAASDALQWAGWIWRGTAVWDKGNSRPQKGRFRQQTEYIVWGSNGDMPINRPVPCLSSTVIPRIPYICGALHVERGDQAILWSCETDEDAARAAERDGVKQLYGIPCVEDGIYLDTPENRQLLGLYSRDMQRTLLNRKNPHKGYDR